MIYRKIKKEEAREFAKLSATAFHCNAENQYKEIEKNEYEEDYIRVLENDDGKFVAGMRLIEMEMYLDGNPVKCGGIGDVGSYPEYRRMGNITRLFDAAFNEMYKNDYVISYLYPFSHPYYRKFGYEICRRKDIISFKTEEIAYKKDDIYARQHVIDSEDDLSADIKKIYYQYAKDMNFMVKRKDNGWLWNRLLKEDAYTGKAKLYVCYNSDDTPIAYFLYEFEKIGQYDLKAKIFDMAFVSREAFDIMLRFIYRLAPAVKIIEFSRPAVINALDIVEEAWEIKMQSEAGGMMRIINVEKALCNMRLPDSDCSISIKVTDDNIKQNNDLFVLQIINGKAEIKKDRSAKPDLECSIHVLSQLVCGFRTIDDVIHRDDVRVNDHIDVLNSVFVKKLIHTQDFF